ncbi:Gustatory receptor [Sergentomyia squamirostris]
MDTTFNCGCFWVSYFLLFYPYFVQNIAANFYFFGTLRAELYFKIINRDVEKITDMLKDLKSLSNYKRIQKFCTLSDRLDFLSMAHYETGILMRAVNSLYGSQMLLFIVIAFLNSLVQLFYLYTTVKFNLYGLEKPNWKLSVYSIMFAYVQIVDLFAHARATQITTTVSQKTGQLLHELPVQNIDDRFKKSVDMFSIQVLQNK